MLHQPITARGGYTDREEPCEDCDPATGCGHCQTCEGRGLVTVACADCHNVKPINEDGVCAPCHDAGYLTTAEHRALYPMGWARAEAGALGFRP